MAELKLRIDGPEGAIPARTFVQVVSRSLSLLRDLDMAAAQRGLSPARWLVSDLGSGSLIIALRPEWQEQTERTHVELSRPAEDLVQGVERLQREAVIPESFTSASLGKVISLGRQVSRDNVEAISFAGRNGRADEVISLTPTVVANARQAVSVQDTALGSVQGFLDVISVREKKRHVSLYESDARRGVYCAYPQALLPRLRDSLGLEIRAWGTLRRNAAGQPVRLDIEDFEHVEPPRHVPVTELVGVAPWWTGGEDAVDYVRRVRGA